jgi:VWFA-related protein
MWRRLGAVLACVTCAGTIAHGRQQQPQATFRASVHLIVQAVSVTDRNGRPVEGLTGNDFVVTEDGRRQAIAFVEYQPLDDSPRPTTTLTAEPLGSSSEAAVPPVIRDAVTVPDDARYHGRRLIVFYFDLYRMPFFDEMRAFTSAQRYLTTMMKAADVVAIMAFDGRGLRLVQAFTDDRTSLLRGIQVLMNDADERNLGIHADSGSAFGEDDDTFNLFTTDRQLSALQTAADALRPVPALKTLVHFGSGLRATGAGNQAQLRATVNAAVRANVTLNPIDARGLVALAPLGDATRPSPGGVGMFNGVLASAGTLRLQQAQDTLHALAKDTGGRAIFDNNDLALGIVQAAQAVTGYYLIGFYTSNTAKDGRYRRVKVELAAGLAGELSYRPGYYGDKDFSRFNTADKERQLAEALRLEDPITEIPMAMEVNYFQISRAEYFVPISVLMPGSELARSVEAGASSVDIDVIGEIKDEHLVTYRNVRDKVRVPLKVGAERSPASRMIQYETGFTVLPGTYSIKLLARNGATGRIGTFQSTFTVPDLEREATRLPTSSVVLTSRRVAATEALYTVKQKIAAETANPLVYDGQKLIPAVTRTFSVSRPLYVFLEAYPHRPEPTPVVAFVTFSREGAKALETAPLTVSRAPDAASRALAVRFTISLADLQPGVYDCQVTVLDPGARKAAFWCAPVAMIR